MLYFINISTKNSLESHFKFMSSLATFFRRLKMIFIVEKKIICGNSTLQVGKE